MVEAWTFGLAANVTITLAFIAVPVLLARDLTRTGQWSGNPLAVATVFLFITCAGSHGVQTLQLGGAWVGGASTTEMAARFEYGWPHMTVLDVVTAFAGVWYWTMRAKFPALVQGTAIFEDLRTRQREALEIHDNIVQGLVQAKLALELDEAEVGEEVLGDTLERAKVIITELLGEEKKRPRAEPGGLRRADDAREVHG